MKRKAVVVSATAATRWENTDNKPTSYTGVRRGYRCGGRIGTYNFFVSADEGYWNRVVRDYRYVVELTRCSLFWTAAFMANSFAMQGSAKVMQAFWSVMEFIVDPTSRQYIPVEYVVDLQTAPGRGKYNLDQYCRCKCLSALNVRGIYG